MLFISLFPRDRPKGRAVGALILFTKVPLLARLQQESGRGFVLKDFFEISLGFRATSYAAKKVKDCGNNGENSSRSALSLLSQ